MVHRMQLLIYYESVESAAFDVSKPTELGRFDLPSKRLDETICTPIEARETIYQFVIVNTHFGNPRPLKLEFAP